MVYFNALEWIEDLRSCSVVLGTRIHGCIAALQAGTPSVITTIDSRTDGLAETLGIPRVALSRLEMSKRKLDPSVLVDKAGTDFNPYIRRRQHLLSVYIKHIRDFGLTPSPRLFEGAC
jgi:polysaccharide pyruvyl transferase WcaK-like protein